MKFITDEILEELSKIGYDLEFDYDKAMTLHNYEKDYGMRISLIEESDMLPDSELFSAYSDKYMEIFKSNNVEIIDEQTVMLNPFIGLYIEITQDGITIDDYKISHDLSEIIDCKEEIQFIEEKYSILLNELNDIILNDTQNPSFINAAIDKLEEMKTVKEEISGLNCRLKYLKCFESLKMDVSDDKFKKMKCDSQIFSNISYILNS